MKLVFAYRRIELIDMKFTLTLIAVFLNLNIQTWADISIYCIHDSSADYNATIISEDSNSRSFLCALDDDIISYRSDTHHIELSENSRIKLASAKSLTFVIKLKGKIIYGGKIKSRLSSVSCSCPVIILEDIFNNRYIPIHLGYPLGAQKNLPDPRNNHELMVYLEKHKRAKK